MWLVSSELFSNTFIIPNKSETYLTFSSEYIILNCVLRESDQVRREKVRIGFKLEFFTEFVGGVRKLFSNLLKTFV